jgi:hypothetical protein
MLRLESLDASAPQSRTSTEVTEMSRHVLVWAVALVLAGGIAIFEHTVAGPGDDILESWFAHLREGMWIKVQGARNADGVLVAHEIRILDGELDEWEVESHITHVDDVRMSLSTTLGLQVVLDPKTRLEGPDEENVSFAFLEVDDRVEIEGQLQKDGTFLAEKIEIDESKRVNPEMHVENEHDIRGRIDSIQPEAHRVVLMGITVQFDAKTRNKTPKVP